MRAWVYACKCGVQGCRTRFVFTNFRLADTAVSAGHFMRVISSIIHLSEYWWLASIKPLATMEISRCSIVVGAISDNVICCLWHLPLKNWLTRAAYASDSSGDSTMAFLLQHANGRQPKNCNYTPTIMPSTTTTATMTANRFFRITYIVSCQTVESQFRADKRNSLKSIKRLTERKRVGERETEREIQRDGK